jgi:hypothetical protein
MLFMQIIFLDVCQHLWLKVTDFAPYPRAV